MRAEACALSIIVPVYNVQGYLPRCLESIKSQTCNDFELILIDDGSQDNSGIICDEFANRCFAECTVIHQANRGLSAARNVGIEAARGRFLLFVDSDDYISPFTVEHLLEVAACRHADIVEFEFAKVNESQEVKWGDPKGSFNTVWRDSEKLIHVLGPTKSHPVAWNKLYRASLFAKRRFPVGKIHEDEFLVPYLADEAGVYVRSKALLYAYVKRNGSIVNRPISRANLDALEAFEGRYVYFRLAYSSRYDALNSYNCLCATRKMLIGGKGILSQKEAQDLVGKYLHYLEVARKDEARGLTKPRKLKLIALLLSRRAFARQQRISYGIARR